jgi:hypothetical protein
MRRIRFSLLLLFLVAAIAGAGCSGINVSKSISPLDFFLPGLLQNTPQPPPVPVSTNSVSLLAQASFVGHCND